MMKRIRRMLQREFDGLAPAYNRIAVPHEAHERRQFAAWVRTGCQDSVLDVGCGPAALARLMARRAKRVLGLDLSYRMLEAARLVQKAPSNLLFTQGNAERLPFPDASFDLVTCTYSFANFPDPLKALREMARVACASGRIALMEVIAPQDPARHAYLNRLEAQRGHFHVRILSHDEYLALFENTGLFLISSKTLRRRQLCREWLRLSPAASNRQRANRLRRMILNSVEGDLAGLHPRRRGRKLFLYYQTAWFLLQPNREARSSNQHSKLFGS